MWPVCCLSRSMIMLAECITRAILDHSFEMVNPLVSETIVIDFSYSYTGFDGFIGEKKRFPQDISFYCRGNIWGYQDSQDDIGIDLCTKIKCLFLQRIFPNFEG